MADRQDTIAGWKGPIYLSTVFHLCRSLRAFEPFFSHPQLQHYRTH